MKKIYLKVDHSATCSNDRDGWHLYSFDRSHLSYADRDRFFLTSEAACQDERRPTFEIAEAIADGRAFPLDYSEHGSCLWELGTWRKGEDVARADGILVWEAEDDLVGGLDDREKSARMFCEEYTAWANGEVYGYVVEDGFGVTVDSCWGFCGTDDTLDYMFEQIGEYVGPGERVVWAGEARDAVLTDERVVKMHPRGDISPEVVEVLLPEGTWEDLKKLLGTLSGEALGIAGRRLARDLEVARVRRVG